MAIKHTFTNHKDVDSLLPIPLREKGSQSITTSHPQIKVTGLQYCRITLLVFRSHLTDITNKSYPYCVRGMLPRLLLKHRTLSTNMCAHVCETKTNWRLL